VARLPGERRGNPPVLKKFGQHFLNDEKILAAIVDALGPTLSDTVVEVGPGRGSLTQIIVPRAGRLVAIEIDRALAAQLREKYTGNPRVEIVEADILATDLHALAGPEFLLVGNVPYYITTPILFKALEPPIPARSVFLVQREVADRMTARENTESYGALSVNVAVVANVEKVLDVPAAAFKPRPKVESAVVRLSPRESPLIRLELLPSFRTFVLACFSMRRKQMQRVLRSVRGVTPASAGTLLTAAGIATDARPEVVSPVAFVSLFESLPSDEGRVGG
jgi:16S rRNA (adenine1518-N6/adenine1519-N6)-dimethyltransferase